MLQFVLLSALFAGCYATPFPIGGRVLNGNDAKPGEFLNIVTLHHKGKSFCVGTIIDSRHIITAAQSAFAGCVFPNMAKEMSIQYGTLTVNSTENLIAVESVKCHEHFEFNYGLRNDIAMVTLTSDIPFSSTVQPTVLPKANEVVPAESTATLAGWVYNRKSKANLEGTLQRVDIKTYSAEECEGIYNLAERKYHFCAGVPEGDKGACFGDAGSPIYVNGVQVGFATWMTDLNIPCVRPGFPGVYANLANYVDWINNNI